MATGELHLRFEDVTQDGRVRLEPLAASLGVVWRGELSQHPLYGWARDQGILPISTRFVIENAEGPFAIENPAHIEGSWRIERTLDAAGATNRFILVIETALAAPIGRTNFPPPDDVGRVARVGSMMAEHVFTRPFADAAERRVTELGEYGTTAKVIAWSEPKALLQLPEGAKALGGPFVDEQPVVFGLAHTDSNQHVNSLVYSRLFEEAAVRKLGKGADLLARHLDVRFRKPSFAGDTLAMTLQLYERDGRLGACGAFIDPGSEPKAGRVFLKMELT